MPVYPSARFTLKCREKSRECQWIFSGIAMNLQAIEQEIQSIPGNGPVLEELYKLLESGETIALVGAGASAGLWPLWNEFLQGFIAHSLKSRKINSDEAAFFEKVKKF
jgi:hypothetical protein